MFERILSSKIIFAFGLYLMRFCFHFRYFTFAKLGVNRTASSALMVPSSTSNISFVIGITMSIVMMLKASTVLTQPLVKQKNKQLPLTVTALLTGVMVAETNTVPPTMATDKEDMVEHQTHNIQHQEEAK